jgi:peroxiredoxin
VSRGPVRRYSVQLVIAGLVLVAVAVGLDLLLTAGIIRRLRELHQAMAEWTDRVNANSLMSGLREGEPVPDFTALTVNGATLTHKDLLGGPWVMGFFAGGCGSCRTELPKLGEMVGQMAERRRVLIVIDGSRPQSSDLMAMGTGIGDVVLENDGGVLSELFKVRFFPTYFAMSQDGHISFGSNSLQDFQRHVVA